MKQFILSAILVAIALATQDKYQAVMYCKGKLYEKTPCTDIDTAERWAIEYRSRYSGCEAYVRRCK